MKAMRALLGDGRRAQRGSVLGGVLIITAFLAILSGALMTELSANFLISSRLVNHIAVEATVNSGMALALDQLENTSLSIDAGCPPLTQPQGQINGQTPVLNMVSCAPINSHAYPLRVIASSNRGAFTQEGSHIVIPGAGRSEYLVASSGGTLFAHDFNTSNLLWSRGLGGTLTGPPTAVPDLNGSSDGISNLVPISSPSDHNVVPSCGQSSACVALLSEPSGARPGLTCFMQASAGVVASPAAGRNYPNLAFFGDTNGVLYAYDGSCGLHGLPFACDQDECNQGGHSQGTSIVAGPVVFPGPSGTDEVYVVTSDGSSSQLDRLTFSESTPGGFSFVSSRPLAGSRAVGLAVEGPNLPARVAITSNDGWLSVVQIQGGFGMTSPASAFVTQGGIADSPYWCTCSGGLIGVGGKNGSFTLLNPGAGKVATFAVNSQIRTAPAADSAGDWFVAADDGVHVLQRKGSNLTQVTVINLNGGERAGSAPQSGACGLSVCIYLGTLSSNLYLVPLDARTVVITSCIGSASGCSPGVHPRLWASAEVGSFTRRQTVRVTGWSYYSP